MMLAITLSAVKASIAVGLLLFVVGLVYVLGYCIGHSDGELSAYDRFLHMLEDGEDNAE